MEITLPDQTFSLDGLSGDWTRLTSAASKIIYAYGTSSALTPLTRLTRQDDGSLKGAETSPLCSGVTLAADTDLNEDTYYVEATGYAIQTDDIGSSDPNAVWGLISSDMASNSN